MNPAEFPLRPSGEVNLAAFGYLVDWDHPSVLDKIMFSVALPDFDKLLQEVVQCPSVAKISWGRGTTLLGRAEGRSDLTQFLIEHGADVNAYEEMVGLPIHSAIESESVECVKLLIGGGSRLDIPDRRGDMPLHTAARFGTPEIVKVLLDRGARIYARNPYHLTPLEYAVQWNQFHVVKMLVQHGATTADEKCNKYIEEAMNWEQ